MCCLGVSLTVVTCPPKYRKIIKTENSIITTCDEPIYQNNIDYSILWFNLVLINILPPIFCICG